MADFDPVLIMLSSDVISKIDRRRRDDLRRSLQNPHPDSPQLADQGLADWMRALPDEDGDGLVDGDAGKPVRWVPGEGWIEEPA